MKTKCSLFKSASCKIKMLSGTYPLDAFSYITGVPIPLKSTHIAEIKRLKNECLKAYRSKDHSKAEAIEAKISSLEEKAKNSPNRKALQGEKSFILKGRLSQNEFMKSLILQNSN